MKDWLDRVIEILIHPAEHARIVLTITMVVMIPLTYLLVYITGGIKFVYSHTMYLPIVLLAILHGPIGGLLAALVGGILLGPFMPISVDSNEAQELANWVYRMFAFLVIGGVVGLFTRKIHSQTESIKQLALINPETEIPIFTSINQNFTKEEYRERYQKDLFVFQITNGAQIIELLGKRIYNDLLKIVASTMDEQFAQEMDLFQVDTSRFIVLVRKGYKGDFADDLLKFFDSAFTIDNIPIHLSIVVGVSNTDKSIFTKVDEAILSINQAKKNHLQIYHYNQEIRPSTFDVSIVGSFKEALEQGDLYLVYHPILSRKDKNVVSLESLIRWNHKDHGLLMPGQFVPLIENTQLINHLSKFVIDEAFQMLSKLPEDVSISVNLSSRNFYSRFFVKNVFDLLSKYATYCTRMIFEITESVLMEHPKKSLEIMHQFREKDIRFAIDDFGTGYSSLAYINLFPIDHIKIDRFFIQKMDEENVYKIIKSTIGLAHELDLFVVAEGVESEKHQETLTKLSCDFMQGFLYTEPLREKAMLDYIKDIQTKGNQ